MTKAKRRGSGPQITLTEGAIRIAWADRRLTILPSAQLPDAEEPADFVVDLDQIVAWDAPHEGAEITIEELQVIVQAIEGEFEKLGLIVELD
ncbi:conserved hypothetical protein [Methylocella silvestris BL2]|uniref:Uncharacterized protein n=1 Tax=Methylocella silvestris (strain DSM 15510 / CIP 108128 / LMG 27833 / NCIMB 13906 / BL2) TaxID=395965 RepID=B8EI66_METSB|nr:Imm74 family immunity protein [Methylocella silvestris]ACK50548.1 conserved hypothetical protein [Methylocella silvestris BL2]